MGTAAFLTHLPRVGSSAVPDTAARNGECLKLSPEREGWCLRRLDGTPAFRAAGMSARQACLQFAHSEGVLTLLS